MFYRLRIPKENDRLISEYNSRYLLCWVWERQRGCEVVVKEKQRLIGFQTPLENTEGQAKFLLQVESEFKNIWRETLDLGEIYVVALLCSCCALTLLPLVLSLALSFPIPMQGQQLCILISR